MNEAEFREWCDKASDDEELQAEISARLVDALEARLGPVIYEQWFIDGLAIEREAQAAGWGRVTGEPEALG